MRSLAILLATTVLFLAFKPAVDVVMASNFDEISCCAEKCNPFDEAGSSSEMPDDDCCDNSCNPFTACGNCFLVISAVEGAPLQNLEVVSRSSFPHVFSFASQFLPEFWQPPKLA